jgi:environmental stress-induced protein Ves
VGFVGEGIVRAMQPRLIRVDDAEPQPWRNGGGVRRDLLEGPDAADWLWRVSVADIGADGPFSSYPDIERWFVIVKGAGVELRFGSTTRRVVRSSAPLSFDGAEAPSCKLIDGPACALNLMLRGGAHGSMGVATDAAPWHPKSDQCGLFTAVNGRCKFDEHETEMPAHALLWFDTAPRTLAFIGGQRRAATLGWWMCVSAGRKS